MQLVVALVDRRRTIAKDELRAQSEERVREFSQWALVSCMGENTRKNMERTKIKVSSPTDALIWTQTNRGE